MVDNIFDEIDINEVVQTDVPAIEEIPMLPTTERYDYVFTVWLKSGWSFADYSSMDDTIDIWNKLMTLKKLGLIENFSPVTVWRMNSEHLTQFAVDSRENHTTVDIIRTNDTKSNKNRVSIGVSGRLNGVIMLNIMLSLLEFVEQYNTRSVMIDVWSGSPFNKPILYKYGYSILEHFHRKQNSGPDIAAAFREFIHLYQQSIVPQLISETEYERIKTMFRLHNNQDVNSHFKTIFNRIEVDGYKTLSRQMNNGVIGKKITQETLLNLLKHKKSLPRHICIEAFHPWNTNCNDDATWYLDTYNQHLYDFVGDGLKVRDVRLNSRKIRYHQEFCIAIYCGVRNMPELREVFVVMESNDYDAIKSTMKVLFPGVDTSCLKGILNVED
jgi:hypothetical protein